MKVQSKACPACGGDLFQEYNVMKCLQCSRVAQTLTGPGNDRYFRSTGLENGPTARLGQIFKRGFIR